MIIFLPFPLEMFLFSFITYLLAGWEGAGVGSSEMA